MSPPLLWRPQPPCSLHISFCRFSLIACWTSTPPDDTAEDRRARLSLNPDKNLRQIRSEFAYRKLRPLLAPYVSTRMYHDWSSGMVSTQWQGIVQISINSSENNTTYSLDFAPEKSKELKIPTAEVEAKFLEAVSRPARSVAWS